MLYIFVSSIPAFEVIVVPGSLYKVAFFLLLLLPNARGVVVKVYEEDVPRGLCGCCETATDILQKLNGALVGKCVGCVYISHKGMRYGCQL